MIAPETKAKIIEKAQEKASDRGYAGSLATGQEAIRVAISNSLPDVFRDREFWEVVYGGKENANAHLEEMRRQKDTSGVYWYIKESLNIRL